MSRALAILAAGIVVAVLVAVLLTPVPFFRQVLVPVLVTVALGTAVMAVVARRTRLREREEDLRRATDAPVMTQEPDRG